jgi:hypothetical protein
MAYQFKLARFLENHDEPRAAATFAPPVHRAAAVITYFIPGLRFFHQGQFEGRLKRISPHLVRAPEETPDPEIGAFYAQLRAILCRSIVKSGQWQALACQPAWDGNGSWDAFVAHAWSEADPKQGQQRMLVAVNYAPHASQCYIKLPFPELRGHSVQLKDLLGAASYVREGSTLVEGGLYLDLQPWTYHVFELEVIP